MNFQQAMALAGHKNAATHMRYVQLSQRGPLETPMAALPALGGFAPSLGETSFPNEAANDDPAEMFGDPSENRSASSPPAAASASAETRWGRERSE